MVVIAVALAGVFRWLRPVAPIDAIDPQAVQDSADKLPPLRTWFYWQLMKQGLDRRVDQKYAEEMSLYHIGQGFAGVLALAGLTLIGVGMAIDKRKRAQKAAEKQRQLE